MSADSGAPRGSRAGRNLPMAIAVGLGMGALVVASVYLYKPAFIAVVLGAVAIGLWELRDALATAGWRLPLPPMAAGAAAMLVTAYLRGPEALLVTLLLTVGAVQVWRIPDGAAGYLRDVAAATFAVVYLPFLAGFAMLLMRPGDGALRVIAFIATVVCSDVGGYTAGVLLGRHPMAPTVSPKKSWEGFAGSAVACMACGVGFLVIGFHGSWWQGVLFGLAVVASATVGDLGESMVKRDIGVKDMGTLLPGHGGVMDRLDSLLPTAPVAWLLLMHFVPPT